MRRSRKNREVLLPDTPNDRRARGKQTLGSRQTVDVDGRRGALAGKEKATSQPSVSSRA
jgi:hypothetical protein